MYRWQVVCALGLALGCSAEPETEASTSATTSTESSSGATDEGTGTGTGDGDGDDWNSEDCEPEPFVPPGAVAFYDFEGEGAVVPDVSGNGHDGVMTGLTATRARGKFCAGLYSENDDGVVIPDADAFDFPTGYTLEMWVLMPNEASSPRVHKGSSFTLRASHAGLSYVAHEPCFSGGGSHEPGFGLDTWHHIAGVWDGTTWLYYVDAELSHDVECLLTPETNPIEVQIGQGVAGSFIDDVALFDHVREPSQICADARGTWTGDACTMPPDASGP